MEMVKYDPILYKQDSDNRAVVADGLNVVIKETRVRLWDQVWLGVD